MISECGKRKDEQERFSQICLDRKLLLTQISQIMLEPAHTVIEFMGGPKDVASILGKHISRIYRWTYAEERGGTGGIIPSREQVKLLAHSREYGLELTPDDFFSHERLRGLIEARASDKEAAE